MMQQAGVDQNVTATAEFYPPVIALGQTAIYRVMVTAMIEGVSLPETLPLPPGLQLTLAARGFNYANMMATIQPRTTLNYRVNVTNTGAFVMPSFAGSANGKPVTIPEARLTVLPAEAAGERQIMRLLVEVPEGEFYIGQAIPLRLVVLDQGNNGVQAISQPLVTGEALLSEQSLNRQGREVRNQKGKAVQACLTGVLVTPIKEGKIEFIAQAYAYINRFAAAPNMGATLETVLLNSDPTSVTVKHLPRDGELPGFTGAIGTFAAEAPKLSTNTVRAGEPITLSVTVKGDGNLTRLIPPKLERTRDWQAFPPLGDSTGSLQIQLRGAATFTYTLIPLHDKVRATPAIPFSYFDPKRKAYVDATITPVPLTVLPAPGGPAPAVEVARVSVPSVDDPDQSGGERDLVMTGLAETPGHRASSLAPLQARPWFWALQLIPALALGGLGLWDRRRRYLAQHPEVVLKARARRRLRRHVRLLQRAAAAREATGFVHAAVGALREVCAPFEAANPEALVCADVLRALGPAERIGTEGRLVCALFAAADAHHFEDQAPEGAAVLALQPELEALLAKWREKL